MGNVISCSVIIKDDFNNALLLERKVKKGEPKLWSLCGKSIKGKETTEKCIDKAAKNDLKVVLFELQPFKEFVVDEETGDTVLVYTATIKERATCDKEVIASKWIGKRSFEEYEFSEIDKKILASYWEIN